MQRKSYSEMDDVFEAGVQAFIEGIKIYDVPPNLNVEDTYLWQTGWLSSQTIFHRIKQK